jgi:glucose-6-phosphate dehydrogenase assembly protein OpcA
VEAAVIVDLPSTTTKEVSKRLVALRNQVGAMAMGRVLTLVVLVEDSGADPAIRTANDATRQHPARIVVLVRANRRGRNRLDAQIRVGGDAGASEIVVLRMYGELADHADAVVTPLLLPDSPIVAWWPQEPPADVASSPLGAMAHRRITDAAACAKPATQLRRRCQHYLPGDTDLAWTRITRWRGVLAAALDQPPFEPVTAVTVTAEPDSPSADLMGGWLAQALQAPVRRARSAAGTGLVSVRLERASGPVDLVRADDAGSLATLSQPDQPLRKVALAQAELSECLAAELHRLDPDEVYAAALCDGLPRIGRRSTTRSRAVRAGLAPEGPAPVEQATPSMSSRSLADADPQDTAVDQEVLEQRIEERLGTFEGGLERVSPDPAALAAAVAGELVVEVAEAVRSRGVAHVVLTGGSMGAATVRSLADLDLDPRTWDRVHLWWGDERFVPQGHPDRNDQQALDAGLDRLPVPPGNIHPMPAGEHESALLEAARAYAAQLAAYAEPPASGRDSTAAAADSADWSTRERVAVPTFDVVLLGVGPDAHVASLFPGRPELETTDVATVPVSASPKPPPLRISLTVPALRAGRQVWFVVAGADKAQAVIAARSAHDDVELPASWVRGSQETIWWLDRAAAGDDG